MVNKEFILLSVLIFVLVSLSFVSAEEIDFVGVDYFNRTYTTEVNISINNTGEDGGNITELFITLPTGAIFDLDTNFTYAGVSGDTGTVVNFTNFSNSNGQQVLVWTNLSNGFIENTTIDALDSASQVFGFNITMTVAGTDYFIINTSHAAGGQFSNQTTFLIYTYFSFDGFVKNETGDFQSNTNITIYGFEEGANGPPTESLIGSAISDGNGFFQFPSVNGTYSNYKIKLVYCNDTDYAIETANAAKVGTVLPPFPSILYYPVWGAESIDMGLNGSTFYLQEATTLNLTAQNSTGDAINFGYEVVDQIVGFPIESNVMGNVSSKQVVVPTGRDYTIMMVREFSQFPTGATCNGEIMSDGGGDVCPAPPKSNSTIGTTWSTLPAESVIEVTFNLSTTKIQVYGCINIADGNNNSMINVTNIIPRLLPWSGFVIQGLNADDGTLNISDNQTMHNAEDIYDTNEFCNNMTAGNVTAFYNLSLLSGTDYMLEFYAKNASDEAGHSNGALDLAGFQNISTGTTDMIQNITLYRLLGDYNETTSQNTSFMTIDIYNSTGDTLTTKLGHVIVKTKSPVTGTVSYVIESIVNGSFTFPILNNTEWAKILVFSSDGPPIERTLNLSNSTNFVKLRTIDFSSGGDKGLRTTNSAGDFVTLNASSTNLELEFISRRTGCDVVAPAESCIITEMNASSFNPLKAMVAGRINMRLKFTGTGASLLFRDFDMFSAKQPPMFSILNTAPFAGTSNTQDWQFGSFAPSDAYKNVTIVMPYSDDPSSTSYINDSRPVLVRLTLLYSEDESDDNKWVVAWNRTKGDTDANLTDDLIDYNNSAFRNYLTSDGMSCSDSDSTRQCYMDTTNNFIYMTVPHFSGTSPTTIGSNPDSTSDSATTGGGGSAATTVVWKKTFTLTDAQLTSGETKELASNERTRFKISGDWHQVGVTSVTATTATIEVSSETQTATLSVGEEKKFELTDDNYNDLSVKLNSITNNKASLTIKSIYEAVSEPTTVPTPTEEKVPPGQEKKLAEAAGTTWMWIIVIAIILIIVAVIVWIIIKKRQQE